MNNIFKKQFLLGLLVISMPALKGWPWTSVEIEQSVKSQPRGRCIGCDLQNKDLREIIKKLDDEGIDIYIAGSNLTGADLSGANMREGVFYSSNLTGVNLSKAILSETMLMNVNFTNADLSRAEISYTGANHNYDLKFTGAKLSGATFTGMHLFDSNFTDANLSGANVLGGHFSVLKFIDAILSGATFSGTRLRWVNFTGADLSGATFENVDLLDPNFTGANLSGATFIGMDLTGVDFSGATGRDVRFINSKIDKESLPHEIHETAEISEESVTPSRTDRLKQWFRKRIKSVEENAEYGADDYR